MDDDELRQRILLKTGLSGINSHDCLKIAERIKQCLGRDISVTTLKRVFGFAKARHSFSKYTLTVLVDYVNSEEPDQDAGSVCVKPGLSDIIDNQISLHPRQLVLEALEMLLKYDEEFLPVVDRGNHMGLVYTKDLINFLTCNDTRHGTLFHKFNFDLCTATAIIQTNEI